jgi:hypothetical protein
MAVSTWETVGFEERPLRELMKQFGSDASLLVRQEMELARLEIDHKIAKTRKELTAVALGGAVVYAGVLALSAAVILVLSLWMAGWVAALIVGGALLIIGVSLLLIGKYGLSELDVVPRRAIENLKLDARTLQQAAR